MNKKNYQKLTFLHFPTQFEKFGYNEPSLYRKKFLDPFKVFLHIEHIGESRFKDNLCTINNEVQFPSSYKYIYPQQQKLKFERKEERSIIYYIIHLQLYIYYIFTI